MARALMGAALWRQAQADEAVELPVGTPPPERGCRYRITVFRAPVVSQFEFGAHLLASAACFL
jgi:hypothetical protein